MLRTLKYLVLAVILGTLMNMCITAAADNTVLCELYSIEYSVGEVCIKGKQYGAPDAEITLNATDKQTGEVLVGKRLASEGESFSFAFSAEPTAYDICIMWDGMEEYKAEIDLSSLTTLLNSGSECSIDKISFSYDSIKLYGSQSGGENVWVTLKVTERGANPALPTSLKAVVQTQSSADGTFEFEFYLQPGQYTAYTHADGHEKSISDFEVTGISDLLTAETDLTESDICERHIQVLGEYCTKLEELLARCKSEGISTDYETVNYSVVKRSIEVLREEAYHNYYDLIQQQYAALYELYREARTSLEDYLNGDKTPHSVPGYVTSDITIDGYGLKATTYDGTKYEERPVFFYGPGVSIDDKIQPEALKDEIQFFSDSGFNYLQLGVAIKEFYVDEPTLSRIGSWEVAYGASGGTQVNLTDERSCSGKYSVKFTRTEPEEFNCFRDMRQSVKVKPNTTYVVGMKVKATNAGDWSIYPAGRNSTLGKPQHIITGGTHDWKNVSVEYTTGDAETLITPTVLVGDATEALYIDDIYVKEKGTDVNLLDDSSFEAAAARNNKAEELVSNDEFLSQLRAEALTEGWYIDYNCVMELIEILELAEENNYLINLIMNVDGLADHFILAQDSTTKDNYCGFLPFAVDHPHVRKALKIYFQTILHMIKDYKSIYNVDLSNEPQVKTSTGTYYVAEWQDYLEEKYGTIDALNKAYGLDGILNSVLGKSYESFEEVSMPASVEATPLYHDWISFNDMVFDRYFEWVFEVAREAAPNLKYNVKLLNYVNEENTGFFAWGGNQELQKDLFDINGCDGGAQHFDNGEGQNTLEQIEQWYDFLTSLNKAPVSNSENHIISNDATVDLDEKWTPWVTSQLWGGAVHRMSMSAMWLWDSSYYMPWNDTGYQNYQNPNLLMRPAETAALGKITLDVNRLSKEITAIQNAEPKAAILYSRTSEPYNSNQIAIRMRAYEQLMYNGQKVGYVTDTTSEEMAKYELVIIPESTHVPAEVLDNVLTYLKNGGRVLIVGNTSLKKDEYGNAHDSTVLSEIYSLATVITEEEIAVGTANLIEEAKLNGLVLKDAETGERLDKTEWSFAEYEGDIVVNILNLEWDNEKTVRIEYNGKEMESFTELRSGREYENTLTLSPYTPALIRIEGLRVDRVDPEGNVLESNIDTLQPGAYVKCNSLTDGQHITAFYQDDTLVSVGVDKAVKIPEVLDGNYRLMATVWKNDTLTPLTKAINITK